MTKTKVRTPFQKLAKNHVRFLFGPFSSKTLFPQFFAPTLILVNCSLISFDDEMTGTGATQMRGSSFETGDYNLAARASLPGQPAAESARTGLDSHPDIIVVV